MLSGLQSIVMRYCSIDGPLTVRPAELMVAEVGKHASRVVLTDFKP